MSTTMQVCTACGTAYTPDDLGWWETSTVLICPCCLPLLTSEDHEELGPMFHPLERSHV